MNNVKLLTDSQRSNFSQSYNVDPNTGCWIWSKQAKHYFGYGVFRIGSLTDGTRKQVTTHRLAYELANGEIPDGLYICHKCDNPACINPNHLYAGTQLDNMRDATDRNRIQRVKWPKGERHPTAKLTDAQVADIRASSEGSSALARRYGVTKEYAWRLKNHKARVLAD